MEAASTLAQPELRIEIWRDEWVQFKGTAAQLVAEGLIPKDFEWPGSSISAKLGKSWTANGFEYWLHRFRPAGHKGPMRSWFELDNWSIRITVAGRDHQWRVHQGLKRKAAELAAEYHRHTAAGSAEFSANWRRYWATVEDKAFQAFKEKIPALVKPKRGRKSKVADSTDSHD